MKKISLLCLCFCLLSGFAVAESASRQDMTVNVIRDLQVKAMEVTVNNIILSRETSIGGREYLQISVNARNDSNEIRRIAVFFVGFDDKKMMVFAALLKPSFDVIGDNSNMTLDADAYLDEGDFNRITSVSIRLVVR